MDETQEDILILQMKMILILILKKKILMMIKTGIEILVSMKWTDEDN
jgi:hypothetical protein